MTRRPALAVALSLLFFVGACGPDHKEADSGAAPADKTELDAAFAAAFPNGATVQDHDGKYTYAAKQLVPVSSDIEALITEGSTQDLGRSNKLKIFYLSHSGGSLALVGKTGGWGINGNPQGDLPDWSVETAGSTPMLTAKVSGWEAGCLTNTVSVYRLLARGLVKDKTASKKDIEKCEGEEPRDDNAASNGDSNTPGAADDSSKGDASADNTASTNSESGPSQ